MAESTVLGVGYRWMHVSNGSGLDAENPSYEAEGVRVHLRLAF